MNVHLFRSLHSPKISNLDFWQYEMMKLTVKTTFAAQDVLLLHPVGGTTQPGEPEPKAVCMRRKREHLLYKSLSCFF